MEQNDAQIAGQPEALYAASDDRPSPAGLAYLRFLIAALVAFMLLIVGEIEAGDASNHAAAHILLAMAAIAAAYALIELARGVIAGKRRAGAEATD